MKILYIAPVIVILVLIYYLFSEQRNKEVLLSLPERFVHYQSLDSSKSVRSGKTEMALLVESERNIEFFLTPENNIIISSLSAEKENIFIKIRPDGNVYDTLKPACRPEDIIFLKGFIIDKENHQFYKWSFTGEKVPVEITSVNEDFAWDSLKQAQKLAYITENSKAVYTEYIFEAPIPKTKIDDNVQTTQGVNRYAIVTYAIGDRCFQLYTTADINQYFSASYLREMLWNSLFKRTIKNASEGEIIKTPNIRYQYFQKLEREKVRFSGGGGNAPGFAKSLYPGYLFTDVLFNTDTLRVKEHLYLDEEWRTSAVDINGKNIGALSKNKAQPPQDMKAYMYYTNDSLKYALFSNDDKKLYVIK